MCNHLVVLQEYGLLLLSGNDCLQVGQFSSDMREREKNPHVKGGGKRVSSLDLSLEIQGRNI